MLRQFNVYRNTSAATRDQLPYYMLIQMIIMTIPTRVIVPSREITGYRYGRASWLEVNIEFETFLIYSPMITNINNQKINPKDFVCNLRNARQDVIAAIDRLLTNT